MNSLRWLVVAVLCISVTVGALAARALAGLAIPPAKAGDAKKAGTTTPPAEAKPAGPAPSYDEVMKDPNRKVGFIRKTLRKPNSPDRIYQVWIPLAYTPDQKWPCILFLHGVGEVGTDGEKILNGAITAPIRQRRGKFDFIVVIPQAQDRGWGGADGNAAIDALKTTAAEYAVDTDRVYLTGYSMGGYGAFSMGASHAKAFAAVVPVAGGGGSAAAFKGIPIWVWHGADDDVVKVEESRSFVLSAARLPMVELRYTEIPGCKHGSCGPAYSSDALWQWLLEHKVSDLGRRAPVKPVVDAPVWQKELEASGKLPPKPGDEKPKPATTR